MAQILNRTSEAYKHLVYWDLDSVRSGEERGHHFHEKETERFYVLSGEIKLLVQDLETGAKKLILLKAGDRLTVTPRVGHAFRSRRRRPRGRHLNDSAMYKPAETNICYPNSDVLYVMKATG
jgi:uncharacterized cupin superfamily protein